MQEKIEELDKKNEEGEKKMIHEYIAFSIAAVSFVTAVLAAIFG